MKKILYPLAYFKWKYDVTMSDFDAIVSVLFLLGAHDNFWYDPFVFRLIEYGKNRSAVDFRLLIS